MTMPPVQKPDIYKARLTADVVQAIPLTVALVLVAPVLAILPLAIERVPTSRWRIC